MTSSSILPVFFILIIKFTNSLIPVTAEIAKNERDLFSPEGQQRRLPPRSPGISHMHRQVIERPDHLPLIDYGDRHPFDLYREHHESRKLEGLPPLVPTIRNEEDFKKLRIKFDYTNLVSRGTHDDEVRIKALKDLILPRMGEFYENLISVIPIKGKIPITIDECFNYINVPNSMVQNGVEGIDLVVFVAGFQDVGGIPLCGENSGTLAAASPCSLDQHDRPMTGFINFCLNEVEVNAAGVVRPSVLNNLLSVGIHEFAHVLGINGDSLKFFRHPITGMPMTPRPFELEVRTCVDGLWYKDIIIPSCHTLREGIAANGMAYFEIVTPTVRQVVRNQFGCQSLLGARLENQPTNEHDCFGTHWDERYFYTETLSAYYAPEADYFSALTLALLEDSGWYRANYTRAEASPFGHGAGCDFVEKSCIQKSKKARSGGVVPQYGEGFFCDNPIKRLENGGYKFDYTCDPTHHLKAGCDLIERSGTMRLPKEGQYFSNPNFGVFLFENADFCPIAQVDAYDCRNPGNNNRPGLSNHPGEVYGFNSLCYDTTIIRPQKQNTQTSMCFESHCNADTQRLEVKIGGTTLVCQFDFQGLGFVYHGQEVRFICPRLLAACPHMFCPANCGGRGICNYNAQFPVCECFDPDDTSNDCRNTPLMIVDPDDECSASNLLLHRKYKSSSWWNTATLTAALTTIALLALS